MSIFKKKLKKALDGSSKQTLPELQKLFDQTVFQIGNATYRKHLMQSELSKVSNELVDLITKATYITDKAGTLPPEQPKEPVPTVQVDKDANSKAQS